MSPDQERRARELISAAKDHYGSERVVEIVEATSAPTFENKRDHWAKKFSAVLPADFAKRDLKTLEQTEVVRIMQQYDCGNDPFGMLLMGKAGVGKTYLLTAMLNHILGECHKYEAKMTETVAYYPVGYLIAKLRSQREPPEFETCVNVRFLFLDDLGTENTTDFAREHFFTILDLRCQKKFPTFITTNLTMAELKEKYTDRIVSRLTEMCLPLTVDGVDRRSDIMKERVTALKARARGMSVVKEE